jgi:hypothetical protein
VKAAELSDARAAAAADGKSSTIPIQEYCWSDATDAARYNHARH